LISDKLLDQTLRFTKEMQALLNGTIANHVQIKAVALQKGDDRLFLLGHLLLESAVHGAETAPPEEPLDEGDADLPNRDEQLDLASFPLLTQLRGPLSEDHSNAEFEAALEHLLLRLDLDLDQ